MEKEASVFFTLLRAGLWESDVDRLSLFPVDDACWSSVLRIAREQTVTGLIYRGILHLPETFFPSPSLMVRLVAEVDRIEKINRKMDHAVEVLSGWFAENGIAAVLQKGQAAARMYEYPELRECGDIDFYFPVKADIGRAASLMGDSGYKTDRMPDGSVCVSWKGICLEFHGSLTDVRSPKARKYVESLSFKSCFEQIHLSRGASVTVPGPELTMLLFSSHIMKHFIGHGIGLRQICDMARACLTYKDRCSAARQREIMEKSGLEKWNRLLFSFMSRHLGLPSECNAYDNMPPCEDSILMDVVLRGGNFGFSGPGRQYKANKIWLRKIETLYLLLRNLRYSLSIVPSECVWIFFDLAKGQLR